MEIGDQKERAAEPDENNSPQESREMLFECSNCGYRFAGRDLAGRPCPKCGDRLGELFLLRPQPRLDEPILEIYRAPDWLHAEMIREVLQSQGILVALRTKVGGITTFTVDGLAEVAVLALESEAARARQAIEDYLECMNAAEAVEESGESAEEPVPDENGEDRPQDLEQQETHAPRISSKGEEDRLERSEAATDVLVECPHCGRRYHGESLAGTRCVKCGEQLLTIAVARREPSLDEPSVEVFRTFEHWKAELVCEVLESNGILASVQRRTSLTFLGYSDNLAEATVLVLESEAERARQIIEEYVAQNAPEKPSRPEAEEEP